MSKQNNPAELHSIESAAKFLGVSHWTIRSWIVKGRLTRVKIGRLTRVREAELLAMIKPEPNPRSSK